MCSFFLKYITPKINEKACDSTVANAAPNTPKPKYLINMKSSTILVKPATITKSIDVLESPKPL